MLKIVSNLVKKHYLQNSGELQTWGKIENYQVYLDGRVYVLDTDGNLTNGASAVSHSLARVVLK
ncbi:MAG: hypothetical protein QG560_127 [Campylobacterota bacterium]|nr:hypothetical protein [Campylobacterota bacterium]